MYYIRTDSSPIIGMGHVMRCLAIAGELRTLGVEVVFIVSNDYSSYKIEENHYKYIKILETDDILDEIQEYKRIFPLREKNIILVDSYKATDDFLNKLNILADVYYIDGLLKCKADIAGVICFNPSVESSIYENIYKDKKTKLLIGNEYIPLRSEFKTRINRLNKDKSQVLLTTGSTDNLHITEAFCIIWQNRQLWRKADLHVVIGNLFNDRNWIKLYKNIQFHQDVHKMSALMRNSNIAVCQAGTTVYELLSQGVPTISFAINEIQRTFSALDPIIKWCGYIQEDCKNSSKEIEYIVDELVKLLNQPDVVRHMAEDAINCFDGAGAERIAKAIIEKSNECL